MFEISIQSNIRQTTGWLNDIERKALPQATRNALNDTAFEVRKTIVERTFVQAFTVRNKRFASASFRVKKATSSHLVAHVHDALGRGNLELHAHGGIKLPRGGRIAVPVDAKRTGSGRIRKADRPRGARQFVLQSKRGPVIARRERGGKGLTVLFGLEPRARITKTFRFEDDGKATVRRRFIPNFRREFAKSVARYRRR